MYPNLKTTGHIKLKYFLWTILLERLLLAKYVTSVVVTLIIQYVNNHSKGNILWNKTKGYTFSVVSDVDVETYCNRELKIQMS